MPSDRSHPRGRGIQVVDVGIAPDQHAWNPVVVLSWDSSGNLVSMQETDGAVTFEMDFTWDSQGQLIGISEWTEV